MSRIRLIIRELGIDGWIIGLAAIAAIVIGLWDFVPQPKHMTPDPLLRMILVALGLTMAAIVAQTSRRSLEISELRDAVGVTSVELIRPGKDFQFHAQKSFNLARRFILDTTLHREHATLNHPLDDPADYHHTLYERVQKREVSYRKIESIYNKERLEYVISRLLIYEDMDYIVRCYVSRSKPIPVFNLMSIDNEMFYLGAFYLGDAPAETENIAFISGSKMSRLFEAYWNNLWHSAKPLNEERRINWDELRSIAKLVEMSDDEFNAIVNKWKRVVQRHKRHA
jgi:hypothetical protein